MKLDTILKRFFNRLDFIVENIKWGLCEAYLTKELSNKIALEIDREILNDLLKATCLDETLPDLTLRDDDWDEYAGFHYEGDF